MKKNDDHWWLRLVISPDSCCSKLLKKGHFNWPFINVIILTYPVRLRGPPLDLIDLALGGCVGQDGVLYRPGHLLDVPDQRLVVIPRRADVTGGVGGPGDTWQCVTNYDTKSSIIFFSSPLTQARWLFSLATGVQGTLMSRMITSQASMATVAR